MLFHIESFYRNIAMTDWKRFVVFYRLGEGPMEGWCISLEDDVYRDARYKSVGPFYDLLFYSISSKRQ